MTVLVARFLQALLIIAFLVSFVPNWLSYQHETYDDSIWRIFRLVAGSITGIWNLALAFVIELLLRDRVK